MIGVLTAGKSGHSREYTYHGVKEWPHAVKAWTRLADTDQPGLFCFGDGLQWEVRITGLTSTRKDFLGRSIRNSLIVQGTTRSTAYRRAARELALRFLRDPDGLREDLDSVLSEEVVEASFADQHLDAKALAGLAPRQTPNVQVDPQELNRQELIGADNEESRSKILATIDSICHGTPGIAIVGDLYAGEQVDELRKELDPDLLESGRTVLLSQIGSTRAGVPLRPEMTEIAPGRADPKHSGGRARPTLTTLILAATLATLSIVAVVTIIRRLLGKN